MNELIKKVEQWGAEKGFVKFENRFQQLAKVMEELGELSSAIIREDGELIDDGIGDVFVTVILLANMLGRDPKECLQIAYDEIKDRKGVVKEGLFIKEFDGPTVFGPPSMLTEEPCLFDNVDDGVAMGLVCTCSKCSPRC